MSALRAAVCKKLSLSATATQADIYRAALKKIGAFAELPNWYLRECTDAVREVAERSGARWKSGSADVGYGTDYVIVKRKGVADVKIDLHGPRIANIVQHTYASGVGQEYADMILDAIRRVDRP